MANPRKAEFEIFPGKRRNRKIITTGMGQMGMNTESQLVKTEEKWRIPASALLWCSSIPVKPLGKAFFSSPSRASLHSDSCSQQLLLRRKKPVALQVVAFV